MISFFPSPYPDELWYSVICRYHVHSGNYCAKHTLRQLYGDNFCAPSLMLCGPMQNNFFCPIVNVIATLHPFHLTDTL